MTTLIGPYNRQKTNDGRAMRPTLAEQPLEGRRYPLAVASEFASRPADEAFASARAEERAKIADELRAIAKGHKARGHAVKAAAVEAAARKIRVGK